MKTLVIVCALVSLPAYGKTVTGDVTFKGETVGGLVDLVAKGGVLSCEMNEAAGVASGSCTVKLADLTTGIDLRDDHMKNKYLEVGKFPEAKIVIKGWKTSVTPSPFEGELTIKGQTKPIKGLAQVDGGKLNAGFTLSLKDYPAIGAPEYRGIGVKDAIAVSVIGDIK